MPYYNKKNCFTFTITSLLLLQLAQAQRPSFAGARPQGLNQKDKYNMNNNLNNNNNSNTQITNRFGTPEETTSPLPFGAAQKPPASFIPVVFPESNYSSLGTTKVKPTLDVIGTRFGGADNSNTNTNAIGSGVSNTGAAGAAGKRKAGAGVPIDAQNDQELVAILNRLPVDQRPFWFINAAAIEAHRNGSFRNFAGAVDSPRSFFG